MWLVVVRFFVKSFPINFKKEREKTPEKLGEMLLLASKLAKSALELNNRTGQLDDDDDAGNDDDYDDSTEPSLASTSVCFYCFRTSPRPSPLVVVVLVFRSGRDRSSTPAADILLYISGISFEFFRSLYDFIRFVALFCSAHSPSCCVVLVKKKKES